MFYVKLNWMCHLDVTAFEKSDNNTNEAKLLIKRENSEVKAL
jgi:hypothetical protein